MPWLSKMHFVGRREAEIGPRHLNAPVEAMYFDSLQIARGSEEPSTVAVQFEAN